MWASRGRCTRQRKKHVWRKHETVQCALGDKSTPKSELREAGRRQGGELAEGSIVKECYVPPYGVFVWYSRQWEATEKFQAREKTWADMLGIKAESCLLKIIQIRGKEAR